MISDLLLKYDYSEMLDGYESFTWLDKNISKKKVVGISLFGDLFFLDFWGHVMMLDLIEGNINRVAESKNDFESLIQKEENRSSLLLSDLVETLRNRKIFLSSGQVYSFNVPMIIGGKVESDNIHVMDLKVWTYLIGQIHEQVKDLPPGTKINGFKLENPGT